MASHVDGRAVGIDQPASPLHAFSAYLDGRHRLLLGVAHEIVTALDAGDRAHASDRMWLWTLGAYEVTRTMCQSQRCFAPAFLERLSALKSDLEQVRVPNTKMERVKYDRKARSIPVSSDRDADEWDETSRDLLVGDPVAPVSSRALIMHYTSVMGSLTATDVTMSHEDSFART
jgi:hypothetical protein